MEKCSKNCKCEEKTIKISINVIDSITNDQELGAYIRKLKNTKSDENK